MYRTSKKAQLRILHRQLQLERNQKLFDRSCFQPFGMDWQDFIERLAENEVVGNFGRKAEPGCER